MRAVADLMHAVISRRPRALKMPPILDLVTSYTGLWIVTPFRNRAAGLRKGLVSLDMKTIAIDIEQEHEKRGN